MFLERNASAKSAASVFYEEFNDVDIYIEDTALGSEKIATKIFSRVFDGAYRVDKVFPLGGRTAVVEQFRKEKSKLKRPSLFVIDGDIYLLVGSDTQSEQGLYCFPFYCIENLLMDESALHCILDEEDPKSSEEDLAKKFDMASWRKNNVDKLRDLFVEYAISIKLNPTEPTVSHQVKNLVSSNDGCLDEAKLLNRINELREKSTEASDEETYRATRDTVLTKLYASGIDHLDFVSGKDYIFPLLKTRFRSVVKTNMTDINFKLRLAKICDITKIRNCKAYVTEKNFSA